MKKIFKVLNVKCSGCANTVKNSLLNEFGIVDVNLQVEPREISLDIHENKVKDLRLKLISLGYPMDDEKLDTLSKITTTTKSYVSCAIGKINT